MTTNSTTLKEPVLDPRYVRRLSPSPGGGYTATIHEFPGCIAEGDTADEALRNLEDVVESWVDAATEHGYKVSPPVDFEGASGKIALRISRRIHQQAAERAELEGTSLNQLIAIALASYLGQQDGIQKCIDLVQREFFQPIRHALHMGFVDRMTVWSSMETPRLSEVNHSSYWKEAFHVLQDNAPPVAK